MELGRRGELRGLEEALLTRGGGGRGGGVVTRLVHRGGVKCDEWCRSVRKSYKHKLVRTTLPDVLPVCLFFFLKNN